MNQKRLWLCICLVMALLAGGAFAQAKSLTVGSAGGKLGDTVTVPVTMTSDEDAQGFVLSVAVDPAMATVLDVRATPPSTGDPAELVVPEILADGFTLGVVMDFEAPYDDQVIPAGTQDIAEVDLEIARAVACGQSESATIALVDGLNSPPLNNILVVGGLSVSALEGLELVDGLLTVEGICDTLSIVSASGESTVPVSVAVDNVQPIEGYVLAIEHDPTAVSLAEITTAGTDAEAVGIEFEVAKTYADGGTLGVVFDFEAPYGGQVLAPGNGQTLATLVYTRECPEGVEVPAVMSALSFVNGKFGTPALSNVLVEGGFSVAPDTEDGQVEITCPPPGPPPVEGITYYVGMSTGGDEPVIDCAVGAAGGEAEVGLYYTSEEAPIQGMSMAICFDPALTILDLDPAGAQGIVGDDNLDGTITQGINAEFVSFNANNTTGELIVGILVDSTPPVPINHMYPPTLTPERVLSVYFAIPVGAECNTRYALEFCDGAVGGGSVPISNRAAVFNESVAATTQAGCLTVGGVAIFIRGDCNTDQIVDIADPAATMSHLFLGVYDPSCMDACDSNDDGMVDLADVVNTLRYLFKFGPVIPMPFPAPGYDPTDDVYGIDLGCDSGNPCN